MQNAIPSSARLIVDGVVTLAMVMLAFLAFDDITTDNATTFAVEYSCLLVCAIWGLVLVIRLAGTRHFVLGGASALVLGAAVWGQAAIGPGATPSWQPECNASVSGRYWTPCGISFSLSGPFSTTARDKLKLIPPGTPGD